MNEFEVAYGAYKSLVEQALDQFIPLPQKDWPARGCPLRLAEAMRYSLLAGGKRLRPVLLLAAYQILEEDVGPALPFAAAVEMIHTYSLIHDDLPAMDNDDLRRGLPTCHKAFGEAVAILAGDALLNLAYETISGSGHPKALGTLRVIAARAGAGGMIAGQSADILLSNQLADREAVRYIHLHKTADLMSAPVIAGLLLGGADDDLIRKGEAYGKHLGLAFQISDDLLDLTGDPLLTGKAGNRDQALGKMTWPAAVGEEQACRDAELAIDAAADLAGYFGKQGSFFRTLALSLQKRVK